MQFDPILPDEYVEAMTSAGWWPNRVLTEYLDEAVAQCPDQVAIVDHNSMTGRSTTLSYRQLGRLANRIALGLTSLGVERNDVVSCQLPNWWQFSALHLACLRIGAAINPLMPIFRERELEFMLGFGEVKLIVVPKRFRRFDYPAMLEDLQPKLPHLEHVLVVGEDRPDSFETTLFDRRWEDELDADAIFSKGKPGPNDVIQVMYTSGTTGAPKGVMHTSNTLLSNLVTFKERIGLSARDVVLMSSPLAHQTGFLYGIILPVFLRAKVVLQDIWDADRAVQLIHDEGVTYTMASTPFLTDVTDSPALEKYDVSSLKTFLSAGAPIPRVLVRRAAERLQAHIVSGWGMTENGAATTTRPEDPEEKTCGTDGAAIPGMEVRVVDSAGKVCPHGEEGRLQARGAGNFVGYLKRPELMDTDEDGWFETGDLARMDEDGYIRISGRSKDIIIRGGENIPVVEVEDVLYTHPAVRDVAITAMPDPRLGERACVFVTLKPGVGFDFEEMARFLEERKMAKQYFPERLEILDEMPRTPSGKIQKFRLREAAEKLTL